MLHQREHIPSGHDPADYQVRRLFAPTADNEEVPITVLHRKGVPIDGSAPLLLEGYGAYGDLVEADFNSNLLSLTDRGFVYAIAHVRGGIEGQALAQCRTPREQGQYFHGFHRGRRILD